MSSIAEVLAAIEKQAEAFEAYKSTNDRRIEALKKGRTSEASEISEELKRIDADVGEFGKLKKKLELEMQQQKERMEELEAKGAKPGVTASDKLNDEYTKTFTEWIRARGQSPQHEAKMGDLQRKAKALHASGEADTKAITIGTGAAGGFAVPEQIARQIEKLELLLSPVRRICKVVRVGTSDYKELVNIRGASAGWVGETGTRAETDTPQLREVTPTMGELYAYPQASDWSLDDLFFNVENWLAEEVSEAFAEYEGQAVIDGNGTNRPTGMLNTTPVVTADWATPLRAAAAYQYLPIPTVSSPSTFTEIDPDYLIQLVYLLNSKYRSGAVWAMNSTTVGLVRRAKDDNGQYLWQPGLAMGQPDRLLGYPVESWEQLDDAGTDAFPIAFGNFKRGYLMIDRSGMMITRDNVTNVGFTRFYIRRREGGIPLNNDAIKWIRTLTEDSLPA